MRFFFFIYAWQTVSVDTMLWLPHKKNHYLSLRDNTNIYKLAGATMRYSFRKEIIIVYLTHIVLTGF